MKKRGTPMLEVLGVSKRLVTILDEYKTTLQKEPKDSMQRPALEIVIRLVEQATNAGNRSRAADKIERLAAQCTESEGVYGILMGAANEIRQTAFKNKTHSRPRGPKGQGAGQNQKFN